MILKWIHLESNPYFFTDLMAGFNGCTWFWISSCRSIYLVLKPFRWYCNYWATFSFIQFYFKFKTWVHKQACIHTYNYNFIIIVKYLHLTFLRYCRDFVETQCFEVEHIKPNNCTRYSGSIIYSFFEVMK